MCINIVPVRNLKISVRLHHDRIYLLVTALRRYTIIINYYPRWFCPIPSEIFHCGVSKPLPIVHKISGLILTAPVSAESNRHAVRQIENCKTIASYASCIPRVILQWEQIVCEIFTTGTREKMFNDIVNLCDLDIFRSYGLHLAQIRFVVTRVRGEKKERKFFRYETTDWSSLRVYHETSALKPISTCPWFSDNIMLYRWGTVVYARKVTRPFFLWFIFIVTQLGNHTEGRAPVV